VNVYVDNLLGGASTLAAEELSQEYRPWYLYDDSLSNGVVFTGPSGRITAEWGLNRFADCVAVLDSNWIEGHVTIHSQGETVYDRDIYSAGKNTIIKLDDCYMISALDLYLTSLDRLAVGILFTGRRLSLPLFGPVFSYKRNVTAKAERTRYGIVYGVKQPSLQSFDITMPDLSNEERLLMDDYLERVQYVQPHLVEPFEDPAFPPLWAVLTGGGSFDKIYGRPFRWNAGTLSYLEAK
jgi:hypothetical protein